MRQGSDAGLRMKILKSGNAEVNRLASRESAALRSEGRLGESSFPRRQPVHQSVPGAAGVHPTKCRAGDSGIRALPRIRFCAWAGFHCRPRWVPVAIVPRLATDSRGAEQDIPARGLLLHAAFPWRRALLQFMGENAFH